MGAMAKENIIMYVVQIKKRKQDVVKDISMIVAKMATSVEIVITKSAMQITSVKITEPVHTVTFSTVSVKIVWLRGNVTVLGVNVWGVPREKHV